MKILIVSLLRLGDFIMTLPAISRLKVKYPDCEIHVLINKQFESIASLVEGVDKFFYFDRLQYQKEMSNIDSHILNPYFRISYLSQQLNVENYDHIYNYTHNKLSGFLIDSIHAKQKFGLVFKNDKFVIEGQDWLSYLNNTNQDSSSEFHFCDILTEGQALSFLDGPVKLKIDDVEQVENLKMQKPIIAFQIFTSDEKKNLSLKKWQDLFNSLEYLKSKYELVLLLSPQEEAKASAINNITKVTCDLKGVICLLSKTRLLISLDTSIKHMASLMGVQIIEIALGSSSTNLTGVYGPNQLLVQPVETKCYPCSHSSSCSQKSHLCEEEISPAQIKSIIEYSLNLNKNDSPNYNDLKQISNEVLHNNIFTSFATQLNAQLTYRLDLGKMSKSHVVIDYYVKYFNIKKITPSDADIILLFEDIKKIGGDIKSLSLLLTSLAFESENIKKSISEFEFKLIKNNFYDFDLLAEVKDIGNYLKPVLDVLKNDTLKGFQKVRKTQIQLQFVKKSLELRENIIKKLKTLGEKNESTTGTISDNSSQKT